MVKAKWAVNCASGTTQININLSVNGTQNFDYINNSIRCAVLQKEGYYKLEVWGAQGGNGLPVPNTSPEYNGGYGGYSVGVFSSSVANALYVVVGGAGSYKYNNQQSVTLNISASYNGGGAASGTYGYHWTTASGGGATHIATVSGLLKNLSSYKNTGGSNISKEILVVAGGGGGAGSYKCINCEDRFLDYSASGGGYIGGIATRINRGGDYSSTTLSTGGTQTSGGGGSSTSSTHISYGGFGYGAERTSSNHESCNMPGGGGGWYGGGTVCWSGAAGGSGYIGSSNLISSSSITKHMYCYNCGTGQTNANYRTTVGTATGHAVADKANTGNGYARITYLGASI